MTEKRTESPDELEALQKVAQKLGQKAEAGLKKLQGIVPKNVVDPERWLKVHRPDLLKDEEIASTMAVWQVYAKKKVLTKWLRKRTTVNYSVEFSHEEMNALKFLLENYIIEYETNPYFINMVKGILHDYYEYYITKMRLSNRHLGMIFKALANFLKDGMTDEFVDDEERVMVLKFLKAFLEKSVTKHASTMIPTLNDDGTAGESKFERTETVITISSFVRDELKKAVKPQQDEKT